VTTVAASGRLVLDRAVRDLGHGAARWSATPLAERIALLDRLMPRVLAEAGPMVAAASAAKGYPAGSPWAAEDWASGPWAIAQNVAACRHALRRIEAGQDPLPGRAAGERGGRTIVEVFPAATWDRLLLNGFRAQVRMLPGVTPSRPEPRPHASTAARPATRPLPWSSAPATSPRSPPWTSCTSCTPKVTSSSPR
jgi:hypothetical protein